MQQELVFKLWDMANLITGFSAVQAMALVFVALGQLNETMRLPELLLKKDLRRKATIIVVSWTILYIGAIIGCLCLAKSLAANTKEWAPISSVWYWTTAGRIFAVLLFGPALTYAILSSPVKQDISNDME